MKHIVILLFSILLISTSCSYKRKLTATNISLSPIYSSGMIIRSSPKLVIKGFAEPNTSLALRISNYITWAHTDSEGNWAAEFPEITYKNPFTILVEGKDTTITLKDVQCGDVYVIAGDAGLSALDRPEIRERDSIRSGNFQNFKIFQPRLISAPTPQLVFKEGRWLQYPDKNLSHGLIKILDRLSRQNKEDTSLTGIIDLTVPGSTANAWLPDHSKYLALPDSSLPDTDSSFIFNTASIAGILEMADTCYNGISHGAARIWYDDENWRKMNLPVRLVKSKLFSNKRLVYLRKKIYVPSKYLTSDFIIRLGRVHGDAEYYFNESKITPVVDHDQTTCLHIPDSLMRIWSNLLAVRFFCKDSLSGIYGSDFICHNTDSSYLRSIDENWKYNRYLEPDFPELLSFEKFPSLLYNNFLTPVNQFPYSAIIWHGGSNDLSDLENLDDKITEIFKSSTTDHTYIVYDIPHPSDTLVFGKKLFNLRKSLGRAAEKSHSECLDIE